MNIADLLTLLQSEGEKMEKGELESISLISYILEILGSLVGDESKALEESIQPEAFAKEVLGFEEIQEDEEGTQDQLVYADETGLPIPEEEVVEGRESPVSQLHGKSTEEVA